jgi:hypothetical protein
LEVRFARVRNFGPELDGAKVRGTSVYSDKLTI